MPKKTKTQDVTMRGGLNVAPAANPTPPPPPAAPPPPDPTPTEPEPSKETDPE